MNDLDDEGDNGGPEALLTLGPISVSGLTNLLFSFDYQVDDFDGGDDAFYTLVLDGVEQTEIQFADTGTSGGRIEITIPDGTGMVSLLVRIDQNGDDALGLDNFEITNNPSADPCGIITFGGEEVICMTETAASRSDEFEIRIAYTGLDDDAILSVRVGATTAARDVTEDITNVGDDFTTQKDGVIILRNDAMDANDRFIEGNEVEVTLTDAGGDCSFILPISTTNNQCVNPCDPNINVNNVVFNCATQTDGVDAGSAVVPFTGGPEPGLVVTVDEESVTISGDDPATETSGDILLDGLMEGVTYTLTFTGGGCVGDQVEDYVFTFAAGSCVASDLVINEFLADPPPGVDVNQNGMADASGDEFVELYNNGDGPVDISGFTISDAVQERFTFPAGTIIPAGTGFVVFGSVPGMNAFDCPVFGDGQLGLNNGSDVITLRNPAGGEVVSVSYSSAPADQSFAREPDFTGAFVPHSSITTNPVDFSPCISNTDASVVLPIDLLTFTAATGQKAILVEWSTANERDNDYFLLDRSTDGRAWEELGMVNAGTELANDYAFTDATPAPGTNLYRLRQMDLDGTQTNYGPVSVNFSGGGSLTLFPNPATSTVHLNRTVEAGDVVTVASVTGKVLRRLPVGSNAVEISGLPGGLYLLSFERGAGREVQRFVKSVSGL